MATSVADPRPVGIFGGMFDPVHFGHLRIALDIAAALDLCQVRLLPCGQPVHRSQTQASAEQRLQMLELSVIGEPMLCIDRRELERSGPSYMIDTLLSLREELGDQSLCLILGMDAFAALDSWHQWTRLIDLAHLVVVQRPGQQARLSEPVSILLAKHQVTQAQALHQQAAGRILIQSASRLEISSTAIRKMIAQGINPRYLLPDPVLALIRQEHLYEHR